MRGSGNESGARGRAALAGVLGTLVAMAAALVLPAASQALMWRPDEPVTLTGARLQPLQGKPPGRVVGFRRVRGAWQQVPVQIDERFEADFGKGPNQVEGDTVEGTVYGTEPSGYTAMQYADPGTFVGADPDPRFDADDELSFMAGDSGGRARKKHGKPRGVRGHGAVRVVLRDPIHYGKPTYLYLFKSKGRRKPAAGKDYVDYDFALDSGDYKSTYRRGQGPNPEHSTISTDAYEIGFSDRWYYDQLRLRGAGSESPDILDGFKFSFGPSSCGRSEATFNAAEGAFATNIDGPVRAIRAYVGANSGPRTERTNIFYRDRHEIITDLRVHPVPGPLIYHDLSAAGLGMTFLSASDPTSVTVDGTGDQVSGAPAEWQLWTGLQGSLFATDRLESSFASELQANASSFYLDDATPPYEQCWGDQHAYGQFGYRSTASMPNTDPARGPADTLHATTTEILSGSVMGRGLATAYAEEIDAPLKARAKRFQPGRRR